MNIKKTLRSLSGAWYNHDAFYRYRIYAQPVLIKRLYQVILTPVSLAIGLNRRLTHQLIIPQVEMVLTTRCNLRCRDCSHLINYYQDPVDIDADLLLQDLQSLTASVDGINKLALIGGESLLHPAFDQILQAVFNIPAIDFVHLVTNSTIIPPASTVKLLKNPKVMVTLSDYPPSLAPARSELLQILQANHIRLYNYQAAWQDLGSLSHTAAGDHQALRCRFRHCLRTLHNCLLDGQYHICPRSAHGAKLGQFDLPAPDFVQVRGRGDHAALRQELTALWASPYLTACRHCNGAEGAPVPTALQMQRP